MYVFVCVIVVTCDPCSNCECDQVSGSQWLSALCATHVPMKMLSLKGVSTTVCAAIRFAPLPTGQSCLNEGERLKELQSNRLDHKRQTPGLATRAAIYRSLWAHRKSQEGSLWGSAEKSPKMLGNVFDIFRFFSGTFLRTPKMALLSAVKQRGRERKGPP